MDKFDVAEVVSLYAVAIDSHSWDLFDAIFMPDAEIDYCHELHWDDLASFKRDFAQSHESTAGHQHFLAAPQVVVEGDRAWALTYGRFNVFRVPVAETVNDMSHGGAWYDDELVRTPAGWRIAKRKARNFWWQGSLPEHGPYKRVVDSFPECARNGEVGYINALRRLMGSTAQVVEPAE